MNAASIRLGTWIALVAGAALLSPPGAFAQNCRTIGSSYFCSGGQAGQRSGVLTPRPDVTQTNRLGNNRYADEPARAARPNNTIVQPRQQQGRRIGDTLYFKDGSRCRTTGNRLTCL